MEKPNEYIIKLQVRRILAVCTPGTCHVPEAPAGFQMDLRSVPPQHLMIRTCEAQTPRTWATEAMAPLLLP